MRRLAQRGCDRSFRDDQVKGCPAKIHVGNCFFRRGYATHVTTVPFCDPTHDGKSYAGAPMRARWGTVPLNEGLEQTVQRFRANTWTGVSNAALEMARCETSNAHPDCAARRRKFGRIVE